MKRTLLLAACVGIGFALASSCDTGGTSGSGSSGDQSDAGGTIGGPQQEVFINEVVHAASERQLRWPTATTPKLGTGPAFYELGFDDSAAKGWQSGPGPFGFGTTTPAAPAFGTNTQTQMQNLTPTLYLRKTFTVSAADAAKTDPLQLTTSYNDGFIVYVNGVELARRWAGPVGQFQYHVSAAHYWSGCEHLFHASPAFWAFVFVETEPPFGVACYVLDAASLRAGMTLCARAYRSFRQCIESGRWPGYPETVESISAPRWALREVY